MNTLLVQALAAVFDPARAPGGSSQFDPAGPAGGCVVSEWGARWLDRAAPPQTDPGSSEELRWRHVGEEAVLCRLGFSLGQEGVYGGTRGETPAVRTEGPDAHTLSIFLA